MIDLRVFNLKLFFLIITSLNKMRQCICSPICLALTIIYQKMIPRKLLGLSNLIRTQVFHVHKAIKVVVIGKHKNFMLAIF